MAVLRRIWRLLCYIIWPLRHVEGAQGWLSLLLPLAKVGIVGLLVATAISIINDEPLWIALYVLGALLALSLVAGYQLIGGDPMSAEALIDSRRHDGREYFFAVLHVYKGDDGRDWIEDAYAKIVECLWEIGYIDDGQDTKWYERWPHLMTPNTYLRWRGFRSSDTLVKFQKDAIAEGMAPVLGFPQQYYLAAAPDTQAMALPLGNTFLLAIEFGAKGRRPIRRCYRLSLYPPTFDGTIMPGTPDEVELVEIPGLPVPRR